MDESVNLKLPYIMASQAQKHVTHNEAIRALDALVQIAVIDMGLTTPPIAPIEGDRYIPAAGATDAWIGKAGHIAAYQDGAWMFHQPRTGWLAFIVDEGRLCVHNGTDWEAYSDGAVGGISAILNASPNGAQTRFELLEQEITLSGPSVDSAILIPDRAIVFGVSARTTQTITGASSYECGIAGDTGKYGSALGIVSGSTNSGVTGPTAFYADTPIKLSANGSDFTGGKARIAIHYMLCAAPTA